jgi:hypothetical protein
MTPSNSLAQEAPTDQRPTIVSTDADFQTNQRTIAGSHFGNADPYVTLDGHALTVVTHAPTNVVADIPTNLAAGAYLLTVKNQSDGLTGSFDVTLGTVGPQGPQGPQGAQGHQGPQGPPGTGVAWGAFYVNEFGARGNTAYQVDVLCSSGGEVVSGACGEPSLGEASSVSLSTSMDPTQGIRQWTGNAFCRIPAPTPFRFGTVGFAPTQPAVAATNMDRRSSFPSRASAS